MGSEMCIRDRDFASGAEPTRVGLFLLALDPAAFAGDYLERVESHLSRLHSRYGVDFGRHLAEVTQLQLPVPLHERLVAAAASAAEMRRN